jgi:hypothetical protein
MATAAERRRAQRQLAKEIHAGLYREGKPRRTSAGKAYEQARARQWVKVGKSGKHHHQRRFNTLDNAMNFVTTLNPNQKFYIIARGTYVDASKYGAEKGDAALINWHQAGSANYASKYIRSQDDELFTKTTSYYVRWRNGD